jgi:chorismate mutase/prephenate dehydratase
MRTSAPAAVAYLGPKATFSHIAAVRAFPSARHIETGTIAGVVEQVANGAVDAGVVPIENSTEGGVAPTLEALFEGSVSIRGELVVEVDLHLLARHGDRSRIRRIASHPQPLGQSRRFIAREFPSAIAVPFSSTTAAAEEALRDDETAAITSPLAAELLGLTILQKSVQDRSDNATRFVIIAREDAAPTGRDKTSLVFTTPHERGALRRALEVFDDAGLNLTRIESRPAPGRLWEYVFFTDVEGHRLDPELARALERLVALCSTVRVLGSYPRAAG